MFNIAEKISIPFSYAFKNFINEDQQKILLDWANDCKNSLDSNQNGNGRFFREINELPYVSPLLNDVARFIEKKIIKKNFLPDPIFKTFLSFNYPGAAIHRHIDLNVDGYTHTRFNLLIQVPHLGGDPVYNDVEFKIYDRMLWCCEAGKYYHASTPVNGNNSRINISFGYQIKND